jgi:hypothetical protein
MKKMTSMTRNHMLTQQLITWLTKPTMTIVMLLLIAATSYATGHAPLSLSGQSNTQLGEYVITELPSETLNGEQVRKFELKYENARNPIQIVLIEKAKCKDYIVYANDLEVKYVCNKQGFGAQKLTGKHARFNPELNARFVSAEALAQQQKLSNGSLTEKDALGLVACYFPALAKHINIL